MKKDFILRVFHPTSGYTLECCTYETRDSILEGLFGCTTKSEWYFNCVRFEVFTAVTMKNAIFWDVTPCGS
jgi:hypothetical protein